MRVLMDTLMTEPAEDEGHGILLGRDVPRADSDPRPSCPLALLPQIHTSPVPVFTAACWWPMEH